MYIFDDQVDIVDTVTLQLGLQENVYKTTKENRQVWKT